MNSRQRLQDANLRVRAERLETFSALSRSRLLPGPSSSVGRPTRPRLLHDLQSFAAPGRARKDAFEPIWSTATKVDTSCGEPIPIQRESDCLSTRGHSSRHATGYGRRLSCRGCFTRHEEPWSWTSVPRGPKRTSTRPPTSTAMFLPIPCS